MPKPSLPIDTSTFRGQVAAEIRRRRIKRYSKAADAAKAAGVPLQTWYRWEHGELPLDALPTIAEALACRPRALIPA